ncbi:hypothetical protein [Streptomyces sp. NPDC059819]|uniref:hypothetical protein n=1 Tax=Streptomyces sp. NPDC059819 TaxID=3346963 RepID=UPI003650D7CC
MEEREELGGPFVHVPLLGSYWLDGTCADGRCCAACRPVWGSAEPAAPVPGVWLAMTALTAGTIVAGMLAIVIG